MGVIPEKMRNPDMMSEKLMKSEQASEKGRIRASVEKVGIQVSIGKIESGRVSKKVESR